jgi:putative toxin-antitoxin system antitoxin component (TIGR02293 family)
MKKKIQKPYPEEKGTHGISSESSVNYHKKIIPPGNRQVEVKDYLYSDFRKIADIAPFTIAEWAHMLHISERTLHRYAKDNSAFNGMQVERILLIGKLVDEGNALFGPEGFKKWLEFKPQALDYQRPIDLLHTYQGIQDVIDVIGRLQHGISA